MGIGLQGSYVRFFSIVSFLRARRRTCASHATARTLHPFIPQHRLSPRFLPSPPRSSLALTLLSRICPQTSPPPSQVLQGTPRRLSW